MEYLSIVLKLLEFVPFKTQITMAAWLLLWTVLFYVFFLAYCGIKMARLNGKLDQAPHVVKEVLWTLYVIFGLCDVAWNIIVGTVIFFELPEFTLERITFTGRCSKHMDASGRRGEIARWVCYGWLNPFDAGHCHR